MIPDDDSLPGEELVTAPQVTLLLENGMEVPCDVYRSPAFDQGGLAWYRAVPRHPVALGSYQGHAQDIPPRSKVFIDAPRVGPGLGALVMTGPQEEDQEAPLE